MGALIKYRSEFGKSITPEEQIQSHCYYKDFWIDEVLKKSELYWEGKLMKLTYYLSNSEDVNTLLRQYLDINVFFVSLKNEHGNYYSRNITKYKLGVFFSKGIEIYDASDRCVMCKWANSNGEQSYIKKWFYTENHEDIPSDNPMLGFTYRNDGELERLVSFGEDHENLEDIKEGLDYIRQYFKWEEHPYYHDGNSIFP